MRRSPGYVAWALVPVLGLALLSCGGGDDQGPSDATIDGDEAARLTEESLRSGGDMANQFIGESFVGDVRCESSGFDETVRAWLVDCDIEVTVEQNSQTVPAQFLVDDSTGAVSVRQ